MPKREEKMIEGCLLQSNVQFPQRDILLCKFCPNRSDMVGDLAELCRVDTQV